MRSKGACLRCGCLHGCADWRCARVFGSHGFICAAVDHPHDAAVVAYPDGSAAEFEWELPTPLDAPGVLAFRAAQVALRAGDVAFVLDALTAADADASTWSCWPRPCSAGRRRSSRSCSGR